MDYIQVAGIILTVWVVMRNIGNERECRLRELEIRLRAEFDNAADAASLVSTATNPNHPSTGRNPK